MTPADPSRDGNRAEHPRGRILIIDDEPTLRTVLTHILESWGHVVQAAGTEAEALAAVAQPFDLVILDITLRGGSGFLVASEIHSRQPETVIIACTGHGDALDPARVQASWIRQVLPKPIDHEDLRRAVEQGLRERNERRST